MARYYQKDMHMVDTLLGTPFDPYAAARHLLLDRPRPPYVLTIFIGIFITLILPSLVFQYNHGLSPWNIKVPWAITLTILLTVGFFVLGASIILRLFGFSSSLFRILAIFAYSLTPFLSLALVFYGFNYLAMGELSILEYLNTGQLQKSDWAVPFFPKFILVGLAWSLLVFANSLRALGDGSKFTAFITAFLCTGLLVGASYAGWRLSEMAFPGTSFFVQRFFAGLVTSPLCQRGQLFC